MPRAALFCHFTAAILCVTLCLATLAFAAAADKIHVRVERRLRELARASSASARRQAPVDDSWVTPPSLTKQVGNAIVSGVNAFVGAFRPKKSPKKIREERAKAQWERRFKTRIVDLMQQIIYATQGRIQDLEPIFARHRSAPHFRMTFIFNRLTQLTVDMRRIYTVSLRWQPRKRVYEQITWYSHCFSKYLNVLYIVEHAVRLHSANVEAFAELAAATSRTTEDEYSHKKRTKHG